MTWMTADQIINDQVTKTRQVIEYATRYWPTCWKESLEQCLAYPTNKDLLAALEALVEKAELMAGAGAPADCIEAISQARAAIAKAKGVTTNV